MKSSSFQSYSSKKKKQTVRLHVLQSLTFVLLSLACQPGGGDKEIDRHAVRDTTINRENAYINTFIDSSAVSVFLSKAGLPGEDSLDIVNFYKTRNYEYAWFDTAGLTGMQAAFISLYRNYRNQKKDSDLINKELDASLDQFMEDSTHFLKQPGAVTSAELGLTRQFFIYSRKAYSSAIDPEDLGWFHSKKENKYRNLPG
jgi:hypothetical protein